MKKYLLLLALLVIAMTVTQAEVAKPLPVGKVKYTSTVTTHTAGIYVVTFAPYTLEIAYVRIQYTPAITEDYMLIYRYEYMESGVAKWSDYNIRFMSSGNEWYEEYDAAYLPGGIIKRPTGNVNIIAFGPN